ncbi:hypothetical protein AKJ45_03410, partial [candidate division MSBL1 archaeon SCGC-AAA261F19]
MKYKQQPMKKYIPETVDERDPNVLPMNLYQIKCPQCGSKNVIRKGKAQRKWKDDVQRYKCECGYRFIIDPTFQSPYPLWVVDRILDSGRKGLRPPDIADEVIRESKLRGQSISITAQTVGNIVKKYVKLLLRFEGLVLRETTSCEWQIDDTYEIVPENARGKKFSWIVNVLEVDTSYFLAAHVSDTRTIKASEEALELAAKRAKYFPLEVKCDGFKSHI